MYMPAGIHYITPSQNGRAVEVCVEVDAEAAGLLEKQRKMLTKIGRKPFFSPAHKEVMAAFWPTKFFWDKRIDATGSLSEGVWCEGEWTSTGKELVEGKAFRTFSPTFFVDAIRNDPDDPVHVICCEDAKANMGALENDPAFQEISPLWAHNAKTISALDAGRTAGASTGITTKGKSVKEPTKAELQARNNKLELQINGLRGKDDADSRVALKEAEGEIEANNLKVKLIDQNEAIEANNTKEKQRIELQANMAVARMIEGNANITIGPLDREAKTEWKEKFVKDPDLIASVAPLEGGRNRNATPPEREVASRTREEISVGWDLGEYMRKFAQLVCENANVNIQDRNVRQDAYAKKGKLALQAASFFKAELLPKLNSWQDCPIDIIGKAIGLEASRGERAQKGLEIQAADYTNNNAPSNTLGVLSGTLVLQRTLPFFAYKYPELMNFYTDFSDTPGLLNQTETTRIVVQPAVQKYDPTTDGTGRPKGWSTVSNAITTDVSLTLTDYVAVPINFGQNVLGTTTRRLFDEQSVLAIKALAGYFVGMVTNLFTGANFNSYGTAGTNGVVAGGLYPTYAKGFQEFSMADLDNLDAIFTNGKVPEEDRGVMLNPSYYMKLRGDPRLSFMYAASGKDADAMASPFLSEAKLPKLSGFAPYKAPYLTAAAPVVNPTQQNIVGFAFQKAGIIVKSRLPQDFTQALGVLIPGSVTTVTDPDTKISIMLVQYVSLQGGWAEWRPEVILGAAAGDPRAGLVITSA